MWARVSPVRHLTTLTGLLALLGACQAGPDFDSPVDNVPAPENTLTFPASWAGTWRGTLDIHRGNGAAPVQSVEITLEIGSEEDEHGLPWRLTYAGQNTRDYRLQTVDAPRGAFRLDERNGIAFPAQHLGDTLFTRFSTSGQLLLTRQRFLADVIHHEILVGPTKPATTTKGVDGHELRSLQRAELRRVPSPR